MLDANQLEKLSKAFVMLDKDVTGMISKKEFKETISKVRPIISDTDIARIFEEVDRHKNDKINYSEFLVATINV